MKLNVATALVIGVSAGLISACGGGGGGGSSPTSASSPTPASTPTTASSPVGLLVNYQAQIASAGNTTAYAAPIANAENSGSYESPNANMRGFGVGNFGGNRCPAIVSAPTYYDVTPALPIQIWTSDCHGNFTLNTSNLLNGAVPTTAFVDATLIGDFNNTGADSIFFSDQGLENSNASNPGFTGAFNTELLSQSGKLTDVSTTNLPQDGMNFNHVSTIYNNGSPGKQTIVLTRLGGPAVTGAGTEFLTNNGSGVFTASTAQLPPEIEYAPNVGNGLGSVDRISQGTALLANLNNSGTPYLIAGTYRSGTTLTNSHGVYIYKMVSGVYQRYATVPIPAQYANIPGSGGTVSATNMLGVSNIVAGDFEGTGHPDLAVMWEGSDSAYLQLIHNDGQGNFTDITASANVPAISIPGSGGTFPASSLQAISISGTGDTELYVGMINGVSLSQMGSWRPVLHWVNGQFQYMDIFNGASIDTIASQIGIDVNTPVEFTYGNFGSGKTDLLAITWAPAVAEGTFNVYYQNTFHTFLHQ
ncbi:hypothetical protein GXB81_18215 [Paraburkholderia sp. Ac-20336]|uniref:hypothetical protein n=1 Tax=Paraburkholderia sp. Ac-20336 TaxID=2703886 RepID=UPI00197DC2FF|nr:hypothetical protein [Paraburkholderia sp. Ac-20336]MBN3804971.1 hypothetical protein [Paraburkholderia sp. Ac-20336]